METEELGAVEEVPLAGPAAVKTGRRPVARPLGACVMALALAAGGFAYAHLRDRPDGSRRSAQAGSAELVSYRDPGGRFSLSYPRTWTGIQPSDTSVALLMVGADGASMLVRLVPLAKRIDPKRLVDVKAVTDAIVEAPGVRVLQQRPVEVAGLSGYYYLYTFRDASTGEEGVHSHFFLFDGATLHTLVFQVLPSSAFAGSAEDFDRVVESYRTAG